MSRTICSFMQLLQNLVFVEFLRFLFSIIINIYILDCGWVESSGENHKISFVKSVAVSAYRMIL